MRNLEETGETRSNQFYFGFIEKVVLDRSFEGGNPCLVSLRLKLKHHCDSNSAGTSLFFGGVRQLVVEDIELPHNLCLLVRDVRSDGLEGIHYRVTEEEYGAISFVCAEYSVEGSSSASAS